MSEAGLSAYHVVVHGRVQGVGFRYSAARKALQLGLTGWVRNCSDGTVETHFEGDASQAEDFLSWLRRGPTGSRVLRVDEKKTSPKGFYRSFSIEY
ncbi:MAG: acylphosphatase [Spirochaetales bacterium]|nr:acylphosphatase [Spirochaetales bacterium]